MKIPIFGNPGVLPIRCELTSKGLGTYSSGCGQQVCSAGIEGGNPRMEQELSKPPQPCGVDQDRSSCFVQKVPCRRHVIMEQWSMQNVLLRGALHEMSDRCCFFDASCLAIAGTCFLHLAACEWPGGQGQESLGSQAHGIRHCSFSSSKSPPTSRHMYSEVHTPYSVVSLMPSSWGKAGACAYRWIWLTSGCRARDHSTLTSLSAFRR